MSLVAGLLRPRLFSSKLSKLKATEKYSGSATILLSILLYPSFHSSFCLSFSPSFYPSCYPSFYQFFCHLFFYPSCSILLSILCLSLPFHSSHFIPLLLPLICLLFSTHHQSRSVQCTMCNFCTSTNFLSSPLSFPSWIYYCFIHFLPNICLSTPHAYIPSFPCLVLFNFIYSSVIFP